MINTGPITTGDQAQESVGNRASFRRTSFTSPRRSQRLCRDKSRRGAEPKPQTACNVLSIPTTRNRRVKHLPTLRTSSFFPLKTSNEYGRILDSCGHASCSIGS